MKKAQEAHLIYGLVIGGILLVLLIYVLVLRNPEIVNGIFRFIGLSETGCNFVKADCSNCLQIVQVMPKAQFKSDWLVSDCEVTGDKVILKFNLNLDPGAPDIIKLNYICGRRPRGEFDWGVKTDGITLSADSMQLANLNSGCSYRILLPENLKSDKGVKFNTKQSVLSFKKK